MVRLGIDFGTANTVGVLALPGREPRPLLFDGSPLLPSAVAVAPGGELLVGRDAVHASVADPAAFEPYPKRCIDDGTLLLGGAELPVADVIAAVLRRVDAEATRVADERPAEVALTCPAAWGSARRQTLLTAAAAALPRVRLVTEPVAAASYFVDVAQGRVPVGGVAVVYDFGAGTFDATVVRRIGGGFEVLATEGLTDCGGLDIDAAVVDHLGTVLRERDDVSWQRLSAPTTTAQRRARRQLWDNVRTAKESLSRIATTVVHVPLFDADELLGREQLELLAAPIVDRTVAATRLALRGAGVEPDEVAAVFLTGGSSRLPAVATTLHQALGIVPTVVDQPELAVAEGGVRMLGQARTAVADSPGTMGPAPAGTSSPDPAGSGDPGPAGTGGPGPVGDGASGPSALPRARRWRLADPARRRPLAATGAAVALLAVVGAVAAIVNRTGADPTTGAGANPPATPSPTAEPIPEPTPTLSLAPGLDPCLIGTWRQVSHQSQSQIDGRTVQYSGGVGDTQIYRPDGTYTERFVGAVRLTDRGVKWEERRNGTAHARYKAVDGQLILSKPTAKGTKVLYRNGRKYSTSTTNLDLAPARYVCLENSLTIATDGYSSELVRVVPSPSPSTNSPPATTPAPAS